ncbi:hypothetical protein ISS05_02935 [Candidatus Woesearchaeota archaeon]|nr:hypothetical protein [Candidatus Woesearchaeota archaeon]
MYGCNSCSAGYEVLSKSRGYSLGSAGNITSSATYLITNNFPEYAGMFYSPTQHEMINDIKYGRADQGYDPEARAIQESLQGMPLEFYIPQLMPMSGGSGRQDIQPLMNIQRRINKSIIDEIEEAQKEIMGKEIVFREVEEIIVMRKTRRREIILRDKRKDI